MSEVYLLFFLNGHMSTYAMKTTRDESIIDDQQNTTNFVPFSSGVGEGQGKR